MQEGLGIALIAAGAAVALPTALLLRTRAPAVFIVPVLGACGAAVGAGVLLVLDHASAADWAIAVPLLTVLVPAHVRVVLGPFRRPGAVGRGLPPPETGAGAAPGTSPGAAD